MKRLDLLEITKVAPPALDFVLPGMIHGTVGSLISPGGAGKSMIALQLAIQIAGGPDRLKLGSIPPGKVAYLPAEDPESALHHRLYSLFSHMTAEQKSQVAENLHVYPLAESSGVDIMGGDFRQGVLTAVDGMRLVIIDTLRRFHNHDENDSGAMSNVIGKLEEIATAKKCSILFLHHSNKGMALNNQGGEQQASRGSSVLVDNIRWQSYLTGMGKDDAKSLKIPNEQRGYYVRWGVSKQNYGAPIQPVWLKRGEGGVLERHQFAVNKTPTETGARSRREEQA